MKLSGTQTGFVSAAMFTGCLLLLSLSLPVLASSKAKHALLPREEYLARVQQQQAVTVQTRTLGSLWVSGGFLEDLSADYKAVHLNDTVVIQVVQQTVAEATGDTTTQRQYSANSAITNLPGKLATGGLNPLFGANSTTALKGQGSTSSSSSLQTSLAGQVIA